jgi:glycosyltransferase involved in cell wall biosynthesis
MINFQNSVFTTVSFPSTAQFVFVSDMFVSDYAGGAELTSEALISTAPYEVFKLHSRDVTMDLLVKGVKLFWIFGNFSQLNPQLIPSIVGNLKYSIVEYDFKYCSYRSPEKHFEQTNTHCDCANQPIGKMISAFFYGSMGNWWMSQKQLDRYLTVFPFLGEKKNVVLSSVFDKQTLQTISELRSQTKSSPPRFGWIVLGSESWIKGANDAVEWCRKTGKNYDIIWDQPYEVVLQKLSRAEGFVYLPKGGDTCPRMVIEAKLLDCQLHTNDNVLHMQEDWFQSSPAEIEEHLSHSPQIFWDGIKQMIDYRPTISGYTTVYNAVKQQYPFETCIKSMLQFCDEVCVVDGGSTDSTFDRLVMLAYPAALTICDLEDLRILAKVTFVAQEKFYEFPDQIGNLKKDPRIKVKIIPRDWTAKRHPVFDGMQKAEARQMCSQEYCWQMDADEVVDTQDAQKICDLCRVLPKNVDVMALPVIEGWGSWSKVRIDVTPWKWRLSRNVPRVTHGVPAQLRRYDTDGQLYAAPGTDGCDMIDAVTSEPLNFVGFYTQDADNCRRAALSGNVQALEQYKVWFNQVIMNLPSVWHFSWIDIERKIKLYRDYWQNHWNGLFNKNTDDTPANNMFFDVAWQDVTDQMIEQRATELNRIGGWVWHQKYNGQQVPWITVGRTPPVLR